MTEKLNPAVFLAEACPCGGDGAGCSQCGGYGYRYRHQHDPASAVDAPDETDHLQARLDEALKWIRVVGEELVQAGFCAGDRTVHLGNLRSLIQQDRDARVELEKAKDEHDSLHQLYRRLYALWCRVARAMTPPSGPDITDEEVAVKAERVSAELETTKRFLDAANEQQAEDLKTINGLRAELEQERKAKLDLRALLERESLENDDTKKWLRAHAADLKADLEKAEGLLRNADMSESDPEWDTERRAFLNRNAPKRMICESCGGPVTGIGCTCAPRDGTP